MKELVQATSDFFAKWPFFSTRLKRRVSIRLYWGLATMLHNLTKIHRYGLAT